MNERLTQIVNKAKDGFQRMGKKQKIWLGASIVGILVAIILTIVVFTKTEYEVAFKNLDTNDAAAVMTYLDSIGTPYTLNTAGTAISVPAKEAARLKVDVGSQGLIQNGTIGFKEAFGSGTSALGTTDNEFNVIYQNALNGEVQGLLMKLKGVESAKVLVTQPEESVFLSVNDSKKPSASVVLTFTPGFKPSQTEIDGYYNLVKSSVTGLEVTDITILSEQYGELLSSAANDLISSTSNQFELQYSIQKQYEKDIKENVNQYLAQIFGVDNVVVSVTSSLNFDKKTSQENIVLPLENNDNNGIIISEEINNSTSTSTDSASGVVGTGETDIPTYNTANGGAGNSSETNSAIRNYEVSRIQNVIESAGYYINDLSISVAFEQSELQTEEEKQAVLNYLGSVVRSQLANSGQNINDPTIIDQKVSLIARQFVTPSDDNTATGFASPLVWIIAAVALLVIIVLVVLLLRRNKAKKVAQEPIVEDIPVRPTFEAVDFDSLQNDSQARKNLETLAKRKPDEFVNLLRTWLVDE